MHTMTHGTNAYQQAAGHRSLREQEAEVFRYATGALRAARDGEALQRTRAIADNRRLWLAVHDLVSDPENALPSSLRASIVSVGLAVQREMSRENPNLEFLISINENITAGLSGQP